MKPRFVAPAILAVSIPIALIAPTPAANAVPPPEVVHVTLGFTSSVAVASDGRSLPIVSQTTESTGNVTATIQATSGTLRATGIPGTQVTATWTQEATRDGAPTASGGVEVVSTAPADKSSDPLATVAEYKASGRSVVKDAMATGMTYDEAMKEFGDMDPGTNPPPPQVAQYPTLVRPAAVASTTNPYDSSCVDVSGDAGNATSHACVIRYLDYMNGGDWWFSHKEKVTARDDDWYYSLDAADIWYVYGPGNQTVDWSPLRLNPFSACGTMSVGVSDPKTGVNIGYSGNVCPDSVGPVWTNGTLGFGAIWRGSTNDYIGAIAASLVENPPGESPVASVHSWMHWSF